MKYVWLVAMREFAENAKTKGFWIGILMFPLMLYAGIKVPTLLNEQVPTRFFVLVDQSQQFGPSIQASLDAAHKIKIEQARQEWTLRAITAAAGSVDSLEVTIEKKLGKEVREAFDENTKKQLVGMVARGKPGVDPGNLSPMMTKIPAEKQAELQSLLMEWGSNALEVGSKKIPPFAEPRRKFQRIDPPADTKPELLKTDNNTPGDLTKVNTNEGIESFRPYLTGEKKFDINNNKENLFALVVIPKSIETIQEGEIYKGIEYWCSNLTDSGLKDEIAWTVETEVKNRLFSKSGIAPNSVEKIQKTDIQLSGKDPKKAAGQEKVTDEDTIRQWAPVGAVYLLWVAIFTVAQMLLNNTTEEKQSRVIEVLLSSVTPTELMFGKLLGIAAVGLTMVGAWIGSFILILKSGMGLEGKLVSTLSEVLYTPELLAAFAGYFILGYLLYAGAFLAVGAVVNTLKEAQNMMGPIMLLMSVPLFTMVFIAKEPNGTLAKILSWVPLYTPFVMMNRAAASPPLSDVVGTLILLVISVIFSIWLSGKIFRIGVLRTGQPPKFMELLGWLKS